ncbi:hypothetical protein VRU48_18655 [Pedobacter sp. KR3-3]|uniref:Uncharacterized protein n=1 Tax=Pedobacter albus TaxID=3113905 RepID=A0ABU7ID99_9SPHI|nr:hypothetical protein [Pedobacter sp. KR3-3]MEE1947154.1 hypothetical protein [Pedobacter sp. KR3-3]
MPKNITYRRENTKQWLLALALLLSIFTFAGFAKSSESGLPSTYQTALAYVQKAVAQKRTVLYGKPVPRVAKKDVNRYAVLTYGLLVKVRYAVRLKCTLDYSFKGILLHQKTIPQSFKESVGPNV